MDYQKFEEDLLEYFKNNLPQKLPSNLPFTIPPPDKYLISLPDIQNKSESIIFYIYVPEYNYEPLTSESKLMTVKLNIFITLKGVSNIDNEKLGKIAKAYMTSIFALIESEQSMGGLVDQASIDSMQYFDAVYGLQIAKAIAIDLKLIKETGLI